VVLAHFMYQINHNRPEPSGWKSDDPCKMIYVGKGITLDGRNIQEFRSKYPKKHNARQKMIQDALGMPSLRSPDIPPNPETGNTYKPYVYIDGEVIINGRDLIVNVGKKQKSTYKNGETIANFQGDLKCKILGDGYVSNGTIVGKEYEKRGIFHTSSQKDVKGRTQIIGFVSEELMNDICRSIFNLCEKKLKGIFDDTKNNPDEPDKNPTKKHKEQIKFRLLILPDSVKNSNITAKQPNGESIGIDSFQNEYSEIPTSVSKSATYATIDDMTYMLNPTSVRTKDELARYWGSHPTIGNQTFKKIGMDLTSDFYNIGGLRWYFGNHDIKFTRERHMRDDDADEIRSSAEMFKHGIWHQLNEGLKQATRAARPGSEMVVICVKNPKFTQVEIVLCESVTATSLQKSLLVNVVPLDEPEFQDRDMYDAMEEVLLKQLDKHLDWSEHKKFEEKLDWSMYMEGVLDILSGRKMSRGRLVQHITANFRAHYDNKKWRQVKNKKDANTFLRRARFVLAALARPYNDNREMDSAEEYAYSMGKLVGTYANFVDVKNMTKIGLQPSAMCNGQALRKIFDDVATKISLSARTKPLDAMTRDVMRHIPSNEIERNDMGRDLTLHFYMGLFRELRG